MLSGWGMLFALMGASIVITLLVWLSAWLFIDAEWPSWLKKKDDPKAPRKRRKEGPPSEVQELPRRFDA